MHNTIDSEALTADDAQKRKRNLNEKSQSKWSRVVKLVKSPSKGIMNGKSPYQAKEANIGTKVHIQQDPPAVSEGSL